MSPRAKQPAGDAEQGDLLGLPEAPAVEPVPGQEPLPEGDGEPQTFAEATSDGDENDDTTFAEATSDGDQDDAATWADATDADERPDRAYDFGNVRPADSRHLGEAWKIPAKGQVVVVRPDGRAVRISANADGVVTHVLDEPGEYSAIVDGERTSTTAAD